MNNERLMAAINSAVEGGISDRSLPSVSSVQGVFGQLTRVSGVAQNIHDARDVPHSILIVRLWPKHAS
jgi:hypothetical protein